MNSEDEQLKFYMGKVIRKQRQKKNWSLEKTAEEANLNSTNIGRIERGEQLLSLTTYFKLVIALDLNPLDYLHEIKKILKGNE